MSTSKDNAALQVDISLTAYTDPAKIAEYVRKYGFSEEEMTPSAQRDLKRNRTNGSSHLPFADYGAYEIYANQGADSKADLGIACVHSFGRSVVARHGVGTDWQS